MRCSRRSPRAGTWRVRNTRRSGACSHGYFEWRHCVPPEDCADETIDRVARRLAGGERIRTGDPISYFRGVARNVWLEWRKQDARKRSMIILSAAEHPPHVQVCLERCLATLPARRKTTAGGLLLERPERAHCPSRRHAQRGSSESVQREAKAPKLHGALSR